MSENVSEAPANDDVMMKKTENCDDDNTTSRDQSACSCKVKTGSVAAIVVKPSIVCRICLTNDENCDRLLTPCSCRGTQGFVHRQCLECWLSMSGLSHCELCRFHFPTANHLRYGMLESMRVWFSYSNHRRILQADLMLCLLLSLLTFGMSAITVTGFYYLSNKRDDAGDVFSRYWIETFIGALLGIVLFAFVLNAIVVVKANIVPWFRWWRRTRETELIIPENNQQNV